MLNVFSVFLEEEEDSRRTHYIVYNHLHFVFSFSYAICGVVMALTVKGPFQIEEYNYIYM